MTVPVKYRNCEKSKKLYALYSTIKTRCYNRNRPSWKDYGGRGITMCDEWLNSIDTFIQWGLNSGYDIGLCIDRRENDEGYSPRNCRWVTRVVNNTNQRRSVFYIIDGVQYDTAQDAAAKLGLSLSTVQRKCKGYTNVSSSGKRYSYPPAEGCGTISKTMGLSQ